MNKWLFTILSKALEMATPDLLENMRQLVDEMVVKAKDTVNPWDDIFFWVLQLLVGKPGERVARGEDRE